MRTIIFCRDGGECVEILATTGTQHDLYRIKPEQAFDLALELLKLAAPAIRAKAYGMPYEVYPYDGTSVRDL